VESIRPSKRRPFFRWARTHPLTRLAAPLFLLFVLPLYAQTGSDPWDNAVNVLKTAFTGTIATGLSLVAIVVGGLMFAYGEGQSKKTIAGIVFGVGMAIEAVKLVAANRPFGMGGLLHGDKPLTGEAAFAFLIKQPFDGVVLTGTKSIAHLRENWEAFHAALWADVED
jgi:type IV secretory pathway VirB2 component (pilin)